MHVAAADGPLIRISTIIKLHRSIRIAFEYCAVEYSSAEAVMIVGITCGII